MNKLEILGAREHNLQNIDIDLPRNQQSGLVQATQILKDIDGISVIELDNSDVIRHRLVTRIIRAYDSLA